MKNGHFFCSLILALSLCGPGLPASAQDTGKLPAAPRNDAFTFEVRQKKDTAIKKKDTSVKSGTRSGEGPEIKKNAAGPALKPPPAAANHNTLKAAPSGPQGSSGSRTDSAAVHPDTVQKLVVLALPTFTRDSIRGYRPFVRFLMAHNAVFGPSDSATSDITALRNGTQTAEDSLYSGVFYIIAGVLFLLGILRLAFSKYFHDLFRAFFNPTLSQRQLRDQLSQTPFPSLMLNLFFSVSAGLYLFLVLLHYHYFVLERPLLLIPVLIALIMIIYLFKYLFLRFAGWLFGYQDTAAGYAFTLYMVNKVLGIALLPFILVLAFSPAGVADVALNGSLILIVMLFIYRYIRIYGMARNQIFFQKFHFFIYLCGFEIAPILIVGKLVLIWLNGA